MRREARGPDAAAKESAYLDSAVQALRMLANSKNLFIVSEKNNLEQLMRILQNSASQSRVRVLISEVLIKVASSF